MVVKNPLGAVVRIETAQVLSGDLIGSYGANAYGDCNTNRPASAATAAVVATQNGLPSNHRTAKCSYGRGGSQGVTVGRGVYFLPSNLLPSRYTVRRSVDWERACWIDAGGLPVRLVAKADGTYWCLLYKNG